MKITDIKIYTLDAFRTNWAFIKVETDEGLYGWGEATLGTQEMSLEGCVADYKRLRGTVQQGDLYRLASPYEHAYAALMYVSEDKSSAA